MIVQYSHICVWSKRIFVRSRAPGLLAVRLRPLSGDGTPWMQDFAQLAKGQYVLGRIRDDEAPTNFGSAPPPSSIVLRWWAVLPTQ